MVTRNKIYLNNFLYNTDQGEDEGYDNRWDTGNIGNYWSDYLGVDCGGMSYPWDTNGKHLIAGDGIGDTLCPHPVDEDSGDYYPIIRLSGWVPIADAGPDQSVLVGDTVFFSGTGSWDLDGWIVNYTWDFDHGNSGFGMNVTHVYAFEGIYNVTLMVTDNDGFTGTDYCNIRVLLAIQPPVADAGPNQIVNEGDIVQFMGCNSSGSTNGDPPSVNPSVEALWHMDEGNGSIIHDETANNNDGTIVSATWTSGKYGSALRFVETDLVYEIPASFDNSITTNITMVAWIYWEGPHPGTYSPNSYIFDARDFEGTRGGFILYLDPTGTLIFILLYGNTASDYQIVQSTCKVPIQRWTHIAGVLDYTNGELKLYINGNEDGNVPATEPYHDFGGSHWDAAIGNNRYAPGDNKWAPFNGIIDEIVICNKALIAQELPGVPIKIISYEWDFDANVDSDSDGNFTNDVDATGPTPTNVYGDNGIYNVTLTVRIAGEEGFVEKIDQDVVFCVDVSGSMDPGAIPIIKEGLGYYVNKMSIPDHGAVVLYGGPPILMNPLTDNYTALLTDIGNIPEPPTGPNTPMGDAMNLSIDEILLNGNESHTHVIILLTDGMQNAGTHFPIDEAYNAAYHNITIYTIGLSSANGTLEETTLIAIASITGGKYYYAPNASFLIEIYKEIAQLVEYPGGKGLSDTDTMQVTVNNLPPGLTLPVISGYGDEGSPVWGLIVDAIDPGSDDLTFKWDYGDGTSETRIYYNNGKDPEPIFDPITNEIKSPWGVFPFSVSDETKHIYGDNGIYPVSITISDDDGGVAVLYTNSTIENVPPALSPSIPNIINEGENVIFSADAIDNGTDDLTFTWDWGDGTPTIVKTYYNNAPINTSDPYLSPWGTYPFSVADSTCHTYGDNGIYEVTLTVEDDDGGITTYSKNITVKNVAPTITPFLPITTIEEGIPFILSANSTDPGSDDLTFTWEFEYGPTITNIHYNDGVGPEPIFDPIINEVKSPGGNYPFSVMDNVVHTYGDNGVYTLTLTVEDDDGGLTTYSINITVNNVVPTIIPFLPTTIIEEGTPLIIFANSTDPGSDDLIFTWEFELGPTITKTYYNDGVGPDPGLSPWGIYPFTATDMVEHTYGDNGIFQVTLTVEDDDGDSNTFITNITIYNIAPTIVTMEAYMYVNFTLRVAGEKWHSVKITLYEDDSEIWSAGVTRRPGSPDEQAASLCGYNINFGSKYRAVVDYLPNDPRVNGNVWGGNPVWVILEFQDGTSERLHHTFNVRKTYWNSTHWNHIDPWEVDLTGIIYRHNITFEAMATDPGSDDLIFLWDFGDGGTEGPNTYFNNGIDPDLFPSPEINPINVSDKIMHAYNATGIYTITLTVIDDDGGVAMATLIIVIPG
jgi:PKD repeat protein